MGKRKRLSPLESDTMRNLNISSSSGSVQKTSRRRNVYSGVRYYTGVLWKSSCKIIYGAASCVRYTFESFCGALAKSVSWRSYCDKFNGSPPENTEIDRDEENQLEIPRGTTGGHRKALKHQETRYQKALMQKDKEIGKYQNHILRLRKEVSDKETEIKKLREKHNKEIKRLESNQYYELEMLQKKNDRRRTGEKEMEELKKNCQQEIKELQRSHQREREILLRREQDLIKQLDAERKAKEEVSVRLSKALSGLLRNNNPNIADLSDVNRPTKLAERFSELYDNEWTNAYSILQRKFEEFRVITILLNILKDCYCECRQQAAKQLNSATFEYGENVSPADYSLLKYERKRNAYLTLPFIIEINELFVEHTYGPVLGPDLLHQSDIRKFFQLCIELCWLMVIQDPPMTIASDIPKTLIFNKDYFKEYTKSGKFVDYVVWPAVLIQDGGLLLTKGIVQCCDDPDVSNLRD